MDEERQGQRRWLVIYGSTLLGLMALATVSHLRLETFRDPPVDFRALKPDERFNVYGLTRRQEGSVKLGFAESGPAPEIGIYGNHIIQRFGTEAFDRPGEKKASDPAYFFNYSYANLSLPEMESYLRHIERKGHLPKKLLLVQITSPNADNGNFIVNWGDELPLDVALSAERSQSKSVLAGFVPAAWRVINNTLHEVLSYNTFVLGMLQRGRGDRVISERDCEAEGQGWWQKLPSAARNLVGVAGGRSYFCQRYTWWSAFRRDGAIGPPILQEEEAPDNPPVLDADPLSENDRGINAGDEKEIARHLKNIDEIGRRNGVPVVFVVPPVYETNRRDSIVNQVFDRALALAPEITLIDHRSMHDDPGLFEDSLHPRLAYYRVLAQELRHRKLID